MAGVEDQLNANWFDGLEDELVKELLDDESPFFFLPKSIDLHDPAVGIHAEAIANPLISNVYSGPTIEDVESALSSNYGSTDVIEQRTSNTARAPYV